MFRFGLGVVCFWKVSGVLVVIFVGREYYVGVKIFLFIYFYFKGEYFNWVIVIVIYGL